MHVVGLTSPQIMIVDVITFQDKFLKRVTEAEKIDMSHQPYWVMALKKLAILFTLVIVAMLVHNSSSYSSTNGIEDGDRVVLDYTSTIKSTGEEFDSGDNSQFTISEGSLIQGFYEGVLGMKIGEVKTFEVPPEKGYTDPNTAPTSPNGDTLYGKILIFDVFIEDVLNYDPSTDTSSSQTSSSSSNTDTSSSQIDENMSSHEGSITDETTVSLNFDMLLLFFAHVCIIASTYSIRRRSE